ncbi:MAG: hypothetical protein ACU0BH_00165 [Paracoccaceae bacterium]
MKYAFVATGSAILTGLAVWVLLPLLRPEPPLHVGEAIARAMADGVPHCLGYHRFVLPADFSAMPDQTAEIDQLTVWRLEGQDQEEGDFLRNQTLWDDLGEPLQSWRINGWLVATFRDALLPDRIVRLVFLRRFAGDMVVARKSGSISRIGLYDDPAHHRFARDTILSEQAPQASEGFCINGMVLSGYRMEMSARVSAGYLALQDGQQVVLGVDGLVYDAVDMGRLAPEPVGARVETEQIDGVEIRREPVVWADRTGVLTVAQALAENADGDNGWLMDIAFAPTTAAPHPPGITVTLSGPPLSASDGKALLLQTLASFAVQTRP